MQSPPTDPPSENSEGKSRLDRELDEILSKNDNIRLLPPPPSRSQHKPKPTQLHGRSATIPPGVSRWLETPIIQALALAFIALLLRDISALVANTLCFLAVACIIFPIVRGFQRPSGVPPTQMWRGRTFEVAPPRNPSMIDSVRNWWSSRQR